MTIFVHMKGKLIIPAVFSLLFSIFLSDASAQDAGAEGKCVINTDKVSHIHKGWGVSLCWWANMCGQWEDRELDRVIDWLVSPDGLNYNVFRYNIGGGDDPMHRNCQPHHMNMGKGKGLRAEMPGFMEHPDSGYNWQADSAQIRVMLKIKRKRPDAVFEAFSNSAPWWMTESGCCAGNEDPLEDNLSAGNYEAFAKYLVDVCVHMRDTYGIEFHSLEPFNEPTTDYWRRSGVQEGCHFSPASQVAFLKVLEPVLRQSGLETVLAASDETGTRLSLESFDAYGEDVHLLGQWNVHTYQATSAEREMLRKKVEAAGLRLWMSETGSGGKGIKGNLGLMQRMFDDVKQLKPDVWCDWQYIEEFGDQWCLVRADFRHCNSVRLKNWYLRRQITQFIVSGSKILACGDAHTLVALTPGGKLVLACLNGGDEVVEKSFRLPGRPKKKGKMYVTSAREDMRESSVEADGEEISVSLKPRSICTLIFQY